MYLFYFFLALRRELNKVKQGSWISKYLFLTIQSVMLLTSQYCFQLQAPIYSIFTQLFELGFLKKILINKPVLKQAILILSSVSQRYCIHKDTVFTAKGLIWNTKDNVNFQHFHVSFLFQYIKCCVLHLGLQWHFPLFGINTQLLSSKGEGKCKHFRYGNKKAKGSLS